MTDSLPSVSVIIPARNSASTLGQALASIRDQTYSNITEIIVAAADEDSAQVARDFGALVIDNPDGRTPVALNRALAKSTGDVVLRCDAQSVLPPDYASRAVEALYRTKAANVGGMQVPVGHSFWEQATVWAMGSPLGAGDARYRVGGEEGPVETVYLGVFRRSALEKVDGFDEAFARTQDYELNHRIRQSGGLVWFVPELKVEYRPRGSLSALARQYFAYGRAKRQFNRKHPMSLQWRQLGPPVLVVALIAAGLLSTMWKYALVIPLTYVGTLLVAGVAAIRSIGLPGLGTPLALATMHLAWGLGFLIG